MKQIHRRSFLAAATAVATFPIKGQSTNPNQRGFVVHSNVEKYIAHIASWGVNLVRYQLLPGQLESDQMTTAQYRERVLSLSTELDRLLPAFHSAGIQVIVDLHHCPKDARGVHQVFRQGAWANEFLDLWAILAKKYANVPAVYAFDLLNEPALEDSEQFSWAQLATLAIGRIREWDPERVVSFQPKRAEPRYFENLQRLPPRKVLYSVHLYEPLSLTHQGVGGRPAGYNYPGKIPGTNKLANKNYLRSVLAPVEEFAQANKVGIYVGEFSFSQLSPVPSAYNYLRDAVELFEEYKWRWTYHGYKEADPWEATKDNGRSLALLQNYFR